MVETAVGRGRLGDCAADALLGARRALQIGDRGLAAFCLELFALAAATDGDHRRAAAILAAGQAARRAMGAEPDPDEQAIRGQALKLLDQDGEAFMLGYAKGQALDLPVALSLAEGTDHSAA